jgi:AcrR family transcriptional regulator
MGATPPAGGKGGARGRQPASRESARGTQLAQSGAATAASPASNGDGPAVDGGASPASRRALRNQGRRTMRRLLDAAMEAFDRRGYHATRVNDVVEIAKTSHGTFYLYFSNKEDLLRALVAEVAVEAQGLYDTLADPSQGATWEDLRSWIAQYSALWLRYAPVLRSWTDLASIDPDLGLQVRQTVKALSGALSSKIDSSSASEPVDSEVAGMAVLAMLDRFHYMREFVGDPIDDEALDTLCTIVHRAVFGGAESTGSAVGPSSLL